MRSLSIAYLGDANSVHTRRWAEYFASHGHAVSLIVPDRVVVAPGLSDGIRVERFDPLWPIHHQPFTAFAAWQSLRGAVRRVRPDVLHAHYLTVHGWHARLAGFRPYAITVWGTDLLITAQATRRGRLYARLALSRASLVTGDSVELTEAAVRMGAPADRTALVQFGVDTSRFAPGPDPTDLRRKLGLDGRRVIFSPRSIAPLYRQDVVVRAVARLPSDTVVVMTRYLARDDELSRIERVATECGVADRVRILPRVEHDDMPYLYRLADLVVSVPESDGTPVTLLETLATGKPTVASDVPSVREWLGDLDAAALVPVDDVAATATAMERVLARSQAERADYAARARTLVEDRASYERNMEHVAELYERLARERPRVGAPGRQTAGARGSRG